MYRSSGEALAVRTCTPLVYVHRSRFSNKQPTSTNLRNKPWIKPLSPCNKPYTRLIRCAPSRLGTRIPQHYNRVLGLHPGFTRYLGNNNIGYDYEPGRSRKPAERHPEALYCCRTGLRLYTGIQYAGPSTHLPESHLRTSRHLQTKMDIYVASRLRSLLLM